MRRLIPEFIQQKITEDQTSGSFFAATLFVDISGFTAITESLMAHGQHGAEVLANIIREIFNPLIVSIFEQGGFVTNLAGDAFTSVFPADGDLRETFARAFAAAWRVQQIMAAAAQFETPYGGFGLSVKVGLAAGEVAWGVVLSADKRRAAYYFQGRAIDGCARAEKMARAGEIIAEVVICETISDLVTAEALTPEAAGPNMGGDYYLVTATNQALPQPQPVTASPIDAAIMARFFPPEATRPASSGEFRQVVSMFVSLPTVQTVEQLESFMQTVFALQDNYGGLLNRLDFGDKGANLLLFWGAPTAHENDVLRALNFILKLQSRTVIPVNAGITYRIAHSGYSGGELAGEYTCHGQGTTLAARMIQAAPRGEIWVDENIAARASQQFEIELEGEMAFKGFARKQKVFILLEGKEETEPFFKGTIVGRDVEKKRLAEFLQPLWQGRCPGLMVVWGEPGIGKSRLIHDYLEMLSRSLERTFSVFLCQADEILRESLNPFRYWLNEYFDQSDQQSEARNKRNFNRKLDQLNAALSDETVREELDRTRSFLGALIDLHWPDSLYEQLDARARYENSNAGLLALLQAESLQQPVVLFLEDAQWLDSDTKAFLSQLARKLEDEPTTPVTLIATARPEGNPEILGANVAYQQIDLGKLEPTDLAALAAAQLGSPAGADLLDLLVERSGGNPFFAEQIIRFLQEGNIIALTGDEWQLKALTATTLPADVRTLLVARLDRLTQEVKEVVQTASVLGREFEVRLLSRMLQDDPSIEEKVNQAERASIWSAMNELRYMFTHTMLRDAAYTMQLRLRRQELHKLAAEALEDLFQEDLSLHYGELAYHSEKALLTDKARHYLELAGTASRETYHNDLAVEYFSRALKLTPEADLESRYRLLESREGLNQIVGDKKGQRHDLEEMAKLAELLQDGAKRVAVWIRKAWFHYWLADYPGVLEAASQATILAKEAGVQELLGHAQYARSWALLQRGILDEAGQHAREALAAAQRSDDLQGEGRANNLLGMINLAAGDYYQAQEYLQEYLRITRHSENRANEKTALNNLGVAAVALGAYDAARTYFGDSLNLAREMGNRGYVSSSLINLSWVAAAEGDWQQAVRNAQSGIDIAKEVKHFEVEAEGYLWLGHGLSGLGQFEKANEVYERSLAIRLQLGQENLAMGVLASMARADLAQGDFEAAGRHVAEIIAYLDGGGSLAGTWEPLRIFLTIYQVLQAIQDGRAREFLEIAYRQMRHQAELIPDERAQRIFLENVAWNREIGAIYEASRRTGTERQS